jgi:hypothetical protein
MKNSLLVTLLLVGACGHVSAVQLSGPSRPTGPGASPGTDRVGGSGNVPADIANARSRQHAAGVIRCRSAGIPRRSVIVDYVQSSTCTRQADTTSVYNAVVALDVSGYSSGSSVLMCGDQAAPVGWHRTGSVADDSPSCPREPRDKYTGPRVVEIIKDGY